MECKKQQVTSCIYVGKTTHIRYNSPPNSFSQNTYMVYADVDELESGKLDKWPIFSSRTPYSLLSLLPQHHDITAPGSSPTTWRARATEALRRGGVKNHEGRICLLCMPSFCGVEFNPICIYYALDEGGATKAAVVEVTNFPWLEKHIYVTRRDCVANEFDVCVKKMHVSPFQSMCGRYSWELEAPKDVAFACVKLETEGGDVGEEKREENGNMLLRAYFSGKRLKWSCWELCHVQIVCPAICIRALVGILWQAIRLIRIGATFFPHPSGLRTRGSAMVECVVQMAMPFTRFLRRVREINWWRVAKLRN